MGDAVGNERKGKTRVGKSLYCIDLPPSTIRYAVQAQQLSFEVGGCAGELCPATWSSGSGNTS